MISTGSRMETWRRFKAKFGRKISLVSIDRTASKWKAIGTTHNQHKGNSGRKKSSRTPENEEKIRSLIMSDNKQSVRRLAFASDLKKSSGYTILRKDLNLKP